MSESNRSLVVYFSYSNRTKQVAQWIAELAGTDSFRLQPIVQYPEDYHACVEFAKAEHAKHARPEFTGSLDLAQHTHIFIGFPCWWYTCPMIILSFLEKYDLSDKTILPFVTHGGSGFSNSIADMKSVCPHANYIEGLAIADTQLKNAKKKIADWLEKNSLKIC